MKIDKEKILQAGKVASEVKKYARTIVHKDVPLLEIAEKIEAKILELGGKPAFPVNLSMNNIAAHYTPSHDDKTLASGLIKVDLGVHIDGWVADTAFSLDLENSEENKKIIKASEQALENAIKVIKNGVSVNVSGKVISETIESFGLSPIVNLSGHSIEQYDLHSGMNVPNIGNSSDDFFKEGIYAVEPFATSGTGKVHDGNSSGIYQLVNNNKTRSDISRKIMAFIDEEYNELPFCSRWIVKKFGAMANMGLRELENAGNLHNFNQLLDVKNSKVAQTEHTLLIEKDKVIVTTA